MRLKFALTPEEKAELSELNFLDEFAEEHHRLYSRHYDRIPVLPKHEITLQWNQSDLCDEIEFIDVTPTSLRVRFPLALDGWDTVDQATWGLSLHLARPCYQRKQKPTRCRFCSLAQAHT